MYKSFNNECIIKCLVFFVNAVLYFTFYFGEISLNPVQYDPHISIHALVRLNH